MAFFNTPTGDLRTWAKDTARKLQQLAKETGNKLETPVKDTSGRTMIDDDGVYAYNSGTTVVSPNLVQIDTSELVDASVALQKLQDDSVDSNKVVKGQTVITQNAQMGNATVLAATIGDAEILTAKIKDLAVTDAKVNDLAVNKLTAGTIGVSNVYVGSSRFELDGSVANGRLTISDGTYDRVELGDLTGGGTGLVLRDSTGNRMLDVNSETIFGAYVDSISANQLSVTQLSAISADLGTVSAGTIDFTNITRQALSVVQSELAANAVSSSAGNVADLSLADVTAGTLTAGSVDAAQASVINLDAGNITTGTMTAGSIDAAQATIINLDAGNITTGVLSAGRINVADKLVIGSPAQSTINAGDLAVENSVTLEGSVLAKQNVEMGNDLIINTKIRARATAFEIGNSLQRVDMVADVEMLNNVNFVTGSSLTGVTASDVSALPDTTGLSDFTSDSVLYLNGSDSLNLSSKLNLAGGLSSTTVAVRADLEVFGDITKTGTSNFDRPHPIKADWRLRHAAIESPEVLNAYRFHVKAGTDGETVEVDLPGYWHAINAEPDVMALPRGHFGRAFGEVAGGVLQVTCEKAGAYNVLLIARRDDEYIQDHTAEYAEPHREDPLC